MFLPTCFRRLLLPTVVCLGGLALPLALAAQEPAPGVETAPPPGPAPTPPSGAAATAPQPGEVGGVSAEEILSHMQAIAGHAPMLSGVQITDVTYGDDDTIVLEGQLAFETQRALVTDLAAQTYVQLAEPGVPVPAISLDALTVVPPAPPVLMAHLQRAIDADLQLGGILIERVMYVDDGAGVAIVGRVANENQTALLVDALNAQVLPSLYGPGVPLEVQVPDQIRIVEPSELVALELFNAGVRKFYDGNFAAAKVLFDHAVLEAPESIPFRYWRVVALIALGDLHTAYQQVRPLANLRRTDIGLAVYPEVLRLLEPVQGPIRYTLYQLEIRALLEGPVATPTTLPGGASAAPYQPAAPLPQPPVVPMETEAPPEA